MFHIELCLLSKYNYIDKSFVNKFLLRNNDLKEMTICQFVTREQQKYSNLLFSYIYQEQIHESNCGVILS